MSVIKTAKTRARSLREQFRQRPQQWHVSDFREELSRALEDLRPDAFDGFVDKIADDIDREEERVAADNQPTLFDMDGEYKLGDGYRIAKRLAQLDHAETALQIDDANLAAVMQVNQRKHEEIDKLRPYWRTSMTKEQAVAAYQIAQPDKQ